MEAIFPRRHIRNVNAKALAPQAHCIPYNDLDSLVSQFPGNLPSSQALHPAPPLLRTRASSLLRLPGCSPITAGSFVLSICPLSKWFPSTGGMWSVCSTQRYVFAGPHCIIAADHVLQYLRITLSRVTTTFFLLSFIFFIAQVLIQAFLWTDDNSAFNNINAMVENAGVPSSLLPWLDIKKEHYNLKICSEAPYGAKNVSQVCPTVYDTNVGADSDWVLPQSFRANVSLTIPW